MKSNLVHGVGVNDADYVVYKTIDNKRVICPFYSKWRDMITRCYSKKYQDRKPTYSRCTVCEEWLLFSSFKGWMKSKAWEGKCLDKDLLAPNNKMYSPENCVFISNNLNTAIAPIKNNSRRMKIKIKNIERLYYEEKDLQIKNGLLAHLENLTMRATYKDS